MIAPRQRNAAESNAPLWHEAFMRLAPAICRQARFAFRNFDSEAREEAIQEVLVAALFAFVRLVERGKPHLAYPSSLARFGIAQFHCGRRAGSALNVRDVSSPYAQRKKGIVLERLERFSRRKHAWRDLLVEDKRATPAEIAAMRIDFADWMESLSSRQRRIADLLATGESTTAAAKTLQVSLGRVSQMRRELERSWHAFHEASKDEQAVQAEG